MDLSPSGRPIGQKRRRFPQRRFRGVCQRLAVPRVADNVILLMTTALAGFQGPFNTRTE